VKKKPFVTSKDKSDWDSFTKKMGNIISKEVDLYEKNDTKNITEKLDLHGFNLDAANHVVEKFITESFNKGLTKIKIITGKGLRSKLHENPYVSDKLSILKYSVPEFIKTNAVLNKKVIKILKADLKDGGDGAIYVFLKNKNKFKE
jgi:DNA-nicking Smr family endonuclease